MTRDPRASAPALSVRVGNGFDIHRVGTDGVMVLGGCEFPGVAALVGHSDGDAIAHAIADAVLGAAGLGDLGAWFPDDTAEFAGADSVELLARAAAAARADGWEIGNADCSVVCDEPRIAPRRADMQQRLSAALGAPVSVKGRRPEGLGAVGRGEGVVCFASVVLVRTSMPTSDHDHDHARHDSDVHDDAGARDQQPLGGDDRELT